MKKSKTNTQDVNGFNTNDNNNGVITMNNTNKYIEEIKQLREVVEKLERNEKLNQSQQQKYNEVIAHELRWTLSNLKNTEIEKINK